MSKKPKQPIRRTALGLWLKEKAPEVAQAVGDILPDAGALGVVRNLLKKASPELQAEAEAYIERAEGEAEITARWQADTKSREPLSVQVRPLIVLGSCLCFLLFAVLDGLQILVLKSAYINLLENLLLTSVGGYFVLRSADKFTQRKNAA
ncbi:MAG: hypothetical protein CL526_12625 [Aequorivita sp.]|nr:hypothetical protein [Aequorivita sp.]